MKNNRVLLLLLIGLLITPLAVQAQKTRLKKAKARIAALDYAAAVEMLLPLAEQDQHPEAVMLLADLFRRQKSYAKAANWYQKVTSRPDAPSHSWYYYGMMLLHLNRCAEAQEQFNHFLVLNTQDPRHEELTEACARREQLLSAQLQQIEIQVLDFNSVLSDIGPAFYRNGLVFGSVRMPASDTESNDARPFYDLYVVDALNEPFQFSAPRPFSTQLNSDVHEAIVTFNHNATEIYFTRNRGGERARKSLQRAGLEIVYATTTDGRRWRSLRPLPFNSDQYSVAHPALSPDGKQLYFSSDMPGGYGGKDIYVSHWNGEYWAKPVNLGPVINTEGDELYPFYHASGRLYFSSDGQFGLGGQDIFYASTDATMTWTDVHNLGAPLNTRDDDYGIIVAADGSYGYFASNRSGGIGQDDIYGFRYLPEEVPPARMTVAVQFINAHDGSRVTGARISQCDHLTSRAASEEADIYLSLHPEDCCDLMVKAAGYQDRQVKLCAHASKLPVQVALEPLPAGSPVSMLTNVKGQLLSSLDSTPVAGATITLLPLYGIDEGVVRSAEDGSYHLQLPAECCVHLRVERQGFFVQQTKQALCTDANGTLSGETTVYLQPYTRHGQVYSPTTHLSDYGEEGAIAFRLNVYYHVGRTSVQPGSVSELKRLLRLLEENPQLIVEISAHTDARGDADFNLRLSQRRADNIVRYLLSQGIRRDRLIARGYGETQPVNQCRDGVSCNEAEHQLNRRTVFKVVGALTTPNQ